MNRVQAWLLRHDTGVRVTAHALCLLPLAAIVVGILRQDLGPDPVAQLTHRTGLWALRLLLLCLAITPLRRLTGWPALVRFRRLLGLHAFFYASLHLTVYLVLDLGGYWTQIFADVVKRPFMTMGMLAWLLMLPLAATSTAAAMRRLGRRWQVLHRLVYVAGIAGALHFLWVVKSGETLARQEPAVYAVLLVALLLARLPRRGSAAAGARPSS